MIFNYSLKSSREKTEGVSGKPVLDRCFVFSYNTDILEVIYAEL